MSFKTDMSWSKIYEPALCDIVKRNALHLVEIRTAATDDDIHRATDLVIEVIGGTIATRVRRARSYSNHRDLTLRAARVNGTPTELAKIKQGFAKWYLYAWTNHDGAISDWILVDLDKLRSTDLMDKADLIPNYDQETFFIAIPAKELLSRGCLTAYQLNEGLE